MHRVILSFTIFLAAISCNNPRKAGPEVQGSKPENQEHSHAKKARHSARDLTLASIAAFSKSNERWESCTNEEIVTGFDFGKINLSKVPTDTFNIKICRDDENEIYTVSESSKYGKRMFEIVHNDDYDYAVMHGKCEVLYDGIISLNGFFLIYQGRCYFLSLESHPICVMQLDSNLNVSYTIRTLKFSRDQFYYKTRINYGKDGELYSETFFTLKDTVEVNEQTSLKQVLNLFDSHHEGRGDMELKLGLPGGYERMPFWALDAHEYDYEAIKNKKILELSFKDRISK